MHRVKRCEFGLCLPSVKCVCVCLCVSRCVFVDLRLKNKKSRINTINPYKIFAFQLQYNTQKNSTHQWSNVPPTKRPALFIPTYWNCGPTWLCPIYRINHFALCTTRCRSARGGWWWWRRKTKKNKILYLSTPSRRSPEWWEAFHA